MDIIPLILGSSWASGVNLYLTLAGLGIADRIGWVTLPGQLDGISHPLIILLALLLYAVEFFADKIPLVDSPGMQCIHLSDQLAVQLLAIWQWPMQIL